MYTEIKKKNNKKYFYRVRTVRTGALFKKVRVYLGKDLSKLMLSAKIKRADRKLEKNNENFKTKVDQLKTPKDHEDLKTANLEFSQSITNYCTNARAYLGIIKDDRVIDIEKVIVNFNSSVEEINAKTKQINEKLGA